MILKQSGYKKGERYADNKPVLAYVAAGDNYYRVPVSPSKEERLKMWVINAMLLTSSQDSSGYIWGGSKQVTSFCLDENVLGIVDESHAKRLAVTILNPANIPDLPFIISAVQVGSMCGKKHVKPSPDEYLFLVKFRPPYWKYWVDNKDTTVKVIRWSNSGSSVWVFMDGTEKCVPIEILLKCCNACGEWARVGYELRHLCHTCTCKGTLIPTWCRVHNP